MKCALVSPTSLLEYVRPFSTYHLALTHKVIYDARYCEYYAGRSKAGDYIVLDNSAVENGGRAAPLKDIVLAAVLVKPSVVVLPDYLFDSSRTLDELENALRSPAMRFLRRVLPEVKLCAVVQGIDQDDWLECFGILNDPRNGIDCLGIPKVTGQLFGHRWVVLEKIRRRVRKPCHLFGVWWQDTLADVAKEAQFDFVQGVDTPKPIRLAVRGLGLGEWDKMPRGRDFVDSHVNGADLDLLRRNCEGFVKICGGDK
jgi:hypothetical protein